MHTLLFCFSQICLHAATIVIFHRHFQQRNITGSRISVIKKRGRFENSANLRVLWKNKKRSFWRGAVPKFGSFLWRLQPCCYSDVTLLSTCCVVRLLNFTLISTVRKHNSSPVPTEFQLWNIAMDFTTEVWLVRWHSFHLWIDYCTCN